jgi:hypothetical protein
MGTSRRTKLKKKRPPKCFLCSKRVSAVIDLDDFDEDETPDSTGYKDTRLNGNIICAECVRGVDPEDMVVPVDDDAPIVIEGASGQKITMSGKNKDVWMHRQGKALLDASKLADEKELNDVDDLITKILSYDADADSDDDLIMSFDEDDS